MNSRDCESCKHFCEEDCCPHWNSCPHTLWDKQNCPYLPHDTDFHLHFCEKDCCKHLEQTFDDIVEEYEARISELEEEIDNLRNFCARVDQFLNLFPEFSTDCTLPINPECWHTGDNFCGNCVHCKCDKGIYTCEATAEVVDPDWTSCKAEFKEHPF